MSYDATVIGAGHNGLLAATLLAMAGWRVGVFESAPAIGGATRTEPLTMPGFSHDVGAIIHSLFAVSPPYRRLRPDLERHGLRYARSETPVASLFPHERALTLFRHPPATLGELERFGRGDSRGWQVLRGRFARGGSLWTDLLYGGIAAPETALRGARLALRLGRAAGLETARDLLGSPRALAERYLSSEEAHAWLAPWALNAGFGPDAAGGGMYAFLTAMLAQEHGLPVPIGGSGALAAALAGLLREHGGEIHTGAPVRRVLVRHGRATGIALAGGETVAATRAVIAGTGPRALFLDLLEHGHLPHSWIRRARGFRPGTGVFMLHLALGDAPRWSGAPPDALFAHIGPYTGDIAIAHAQALSGYLPADPFILAATPTLVDPSRAPKGQHTLWVQVATAPGRIRGDAAGTIAATDWSAARAPFAERVLSKLARHSPGLRDRVLAMQALSPDDMEALNPNLLGGDLTSGSHSFDQQFVFRPLPGTGGHGTPIDRLFLIGAGTYPGAGVSGASGWTLARRLLRARL